MQMGCSLISCYVVELHKTFSSREKYQGIRKNFDFIYVDLGKSFDWVPCDVFLVRFKETRYRKMVG